MRYGRTRWVSVIGFFVSLLVAMPAFGSPDEGEISFVELAPSVTDSDQLRLTYEVDRASWKELEQRNVSPHFVVYLNEARGDELGFAHSFKVQNRSGSLTMPAVFSADEIRSFRLDLVGYDKAWRITNIDVYGVNSPLLEFGYDGDKFTISEADISGDFRNRTVISSYENLGDGDRSRRRARRSSNRRDERSERRERREDVEEVEEQEPDSQWRAKTIEACNSGTSMSSHFDQCRELALKIDPWWAEQAVIACLDVHSMRSAQNDCLTVAAKFEYADPVPVIRACDKATSVRSANEQCMQYALQITFEAAPVIAACDDATTTRSDLESCLKHSQDYRSEPAPIISACKSATSTRSQQRECIEVGAKLSRSDVSLINACAGRRVASCVRDAAGL